MSQLRIFRKIRRTFRAWKRKVKRQLPFYLLGIGILSGLVVFGMIQSQKMIDPAAYTPLLTTVAKAESNGNYNAYFGHGNNQSVRFTDMTLDQVLAWQADFIKQGSPSSAVGRYQFLDTTLKGLQTELKLPGTTKFDQTTQDTLAITLLNRRGAVLFTENKVSAEEFAHNLSKEWASLPQTTGVTPEKGYYDGDGLNHALVKPAEILKAVEAFKTNVETK